MATKLTFAEVIKEGLKGNKTKPNPPPKKPVKGEQQKKLQKSVEDTPVAENQNDKQLIQIPLEIALSKEKDSVVTQLLEKHTSYFADVQLHYKVDKTMIEYEQRQNQKRLSKSLLNALINPLPPIQAEQVKLNQFHLKQPVLEQFGERDVENKFIFSESGYKFEDKYQLGCKLGQGGQGTVYTGKSTSINI